MLIVGNDVQFKSFCQAMGLQGIAEDPRFCKNELRLKHADSLAPLIAGAMAQKTMAECQALLDEAGVPASPINDLAQVFANPQVVARENGSGLWQGEGPPRAHDRQPDAHVPGPRRVTVSRPRSSVNTVPRSCVTCSA